MGDGLKLSKDKRHRSSSSIAGAGLEGTRSERKLDIRALIPEVEDHFAVAESRCDDLQEKIDLVKVLKRKKKLNKRSMTRVSDTPTLTDNVPFITVRTQPKKKVSQQATRLRRLEAATNPARGYVDPATVEQHRMLGQVWGYGQNYQQNEFQNEQKPYHRTRPRRNRADGDGGMCGQGSEPTVAPTEVACGQDDDTYSDLDVFDQPPGEQFPLPDNQNVYSLKKRKHVAKRDETIDGKSTGEEAAVRGGGAPWRAGVATRNPRSRVRQDPSKYQQPAPMAPKPRTEERPVVELFKQSRASKSPPPLSFSAVPRPQSRKEDKPGKHHEVGERNDLPSQFDISIESMKKPPPPPARRKLRNRNYELPTLASQLKQADIRYHCSVANHANIPFVVSKSTAPSHNIGVNIQQVLNGVKMQQPLSTIPLTIAHHMGLGHVPTYTTRKQNKQAKPSLNKSVMNAITLGKRLLTLPSHRTISYNRLLSLYRDGDGMVSRFLRAISRPNYLYTSMYEENVAPAFVLNKLKHTLSHTSIVRLPCRLNLQGGREEAEGAASSRGRERCIDEETKRRLAEYAQLCDEYDKLDAQRKVPGHGSAELDRRCEELTRELLDREEFFKKLVESPSRQGFSKAQLRGSTAALSEIRRRRDHP